MYYEKLLMDDKNNKKMWSEINTITRKHKKDCTIENLNKNGRSTSDGNDIVNVLNNYFATVGERMGSEIVTNENEFQNYMPCKLNNSILLTLISKNEIQKIISELPKKNINCS